MNTHHVGIDVGGTFTDFTVMDTASGEIRFFKIPSTPDDPARAISSGIDAMERGGIPASSIRHVGHGTTVATNMIIERKGTACALITTRGFRDVLEIGRQVRPDLYNLRNLKPQPLVERALRFEIAERMMASGEILEAIDLDEVRAIGARLIEENIKCVAICLMHSYRNPVHEQLAAEALREVMPDAWISMSHDILPEFREFERMSTTAMNAYLQDRMAGYLTRLSARAVEQGVGVEINTVHSNGGLMSDSEARNYPVRTCLSGPAAGVLGGALVAQTAGRPNVVTFDVGGTSTDVSLVADGIPAFTSGQDVAGLPIRCQMVSVHVVGAGGGSIARIDEAGALKVGPDSAGAYPGPAGYGRGGTLPTLTDANIYLHRLNPVSVLDGEMPIYEDRARVAIDTLAERLGVSGDVVAQSVIDISASNMARAIRAISVDKGVDVQQFTLMAFGGAGPLHAAAVAREVGLKEILVPESPGTMCARGVLLSDRSRDFVTSRLVVARDEDWAVVDDLIAQLEAQANDWFDQYGIAEADRKISILLDGRYRGQNHEIAIEGRPGSAAEFRALFDARHAQVYGQALTDVEVEAINFRVQARAGTDRAAQLPVDPAGRSFDAALLETRQVMLDVQDGWVEAKVWKRGLLPVDQPFEGPAIVEEMTSTTVILSGQVARLDAYGNIFIKELGTDD